MNYKCTSLITASVLALAAGAASGQFQSDSPRHSLQIAEHLTQQRSSLYSAIAMAESHTRGIAIGVRLTTNQAHFSGQGGGLEGQTRSDFDQNNQQQTGQPRTAEQQRQQREQQQRQQQQQREQQQRQQQQDRQTGQQQTLGANQQGAQSGQLFAVVTCVVDRTRVRDVVIDMSNNTVVGVQAVAFGSDQSYPGQRSGDDRDYSSDYDSSSAGGYALASDLMNATVRTRTGDRLGDIDELAIDPDSNRVVYGVLRRGGFLGMGESRYAIPTSELSSPRNGRIVLGLEESHFQNISGFDNDNWPTQAEPRLRVDRSSTQASDAPAARRVVKASNVIGNDILCRDGHTLGEITDLVVEPRTGRIIYAIVKTDRGHMPVPMATMARKSDETYALPMPMDQLRSMQVLDINRDANWNDESWNRRIHEGFGVRFETVTPRDGR